MIDITTDRRHKCFAYAGGGCTVLTRCNCNNCKFYKPVDCEEWVKIEQDGRVYIMPPEEYDEMNRRKEKKKYVRISDIQGNAVTLDVTGRSYEAIAEDIARIMLIGKESITPPDNIVTDPEVLRTVAHLFEHDRRR